jgi:hypothetical protein
VLKYTIKLELTLNPYPANVEYRVSFYNVSKWQMGFNSAFKGLNDLIVVLLIPFVLRLRLRCRDLFSMDLLYRGCCCE